MGVGSGAQAGRELEERDWAALLEGLNKRIEQGAEIDATIELVADPTVGTEAERMPLDSITYEDGDDQIAIGVGGRGRRFPAVLWHYVDRPRRLVVTGDDDRPTGLIIESEDETLTLVRFYWA